MGQQRLDYAPPPSPNLRRPLLAFLVGYLAATVVVWMLMLITGGGDAGILRPLLIAPVCLLMRVPGLSSEKISLFLIFVVAPALYGLYGAILSAAPPLRLRLLLLGLFLHVACFALLAVV
jgi:hypothetical protein